MELNESIVKIRGKFQPKDTHIYSSAKSAKESRNFPSEAMLFTL